MVKHRFPWSFSGTNGPVYYVFKIIGALWEFSSGSSRSSRSSVTSGIEVGCIVEIVTGAFKGEKARVTSVAETKEEVSMELYEQPIPMTLKMRGDHVRVVERVE